MPPETYIHFRATRELSRALNRVKRQTGMSIGHQIRTAIMHWLAIQDPLKECACGGCVLPAGVLRALPTEPSGYCLAGRHRLEEAWGHTRSGSEAAQ